MRPLRKILLVRTNPLKARTGTSPPLGCLHLAGAVREWLDPQWALPQMRYFGP